MSEETGSPQPQDLSTSPLSSDEKMWAMLAHVSSLAGFIIPFGNIFGPLIIWMIKKEEMKFVDEHGKASLNFQISITIYLIVSAILTLILIGVLLLLALGIAWVVLVIIASLKANNGEHYEYPLTIQFLK